MNCSDCPFGSRYDPNSDFCESCSSDPDTGWGGFTDHRIGVHFNSVEEQEKYYKNLNEEDADFRCVHEDGKDIEPDKECRYMNIEEFIKEAKKNKKMVTLTRNFLGGNMKKIILTIICVISIVFLTGCMPAVYKKSINKETKERFQIIERMDYDDGRIIVDTKTGVLYWTCGNWSSVLLNRDGSPMLYEEEYK